MKFKLRHIVDRFIQHKALVLMYHRVATLKSDVWDLAVSPENFEQQLQLLKESKNVIPLKELIERIKHNRLKRNCIAITFDDGYADNYQIAKPLLEKYQLPATFFITSVNLDKSVEFWWDELEQLILFAKVLPTQFKQYVAGIKVNVNLLEEAQLSESLYNKHCFWKAFKQDMPSSRSKLFLTLWQLLKPLPAEELQQQLQYIRDWAGLPGGSRETYRCLTGKQLQKLAQCKLFDIGAHTASHTALGGHAKIYQQSELVENRNLLQDITGKKVSLLSYPYGNYNTDTLALAADLKFDAAFTTEERAITKQTSSYQIGRFQVPDLGVLDFERTIKQWELTS